MAGCLIHMLCYLLTQVEITASNTSWSDQLRIGLTTSSPSSESLRKIPVPEDYGGLPPNTWMMVKMKGGYILHCNGSLTKDQYRVDYPDQFNVKNIAMLDNHLPPSLFPSFLCFFPPPSLSLSLPPPLSLYVAT